MGGKFTMKLKLNQRVSVGLIPKNQFNVKIQLRTDKDVDAELWTAGGKREIAIVAWMVGKINSPTKASIHWGGGLISYSGYNGITDKNGMNFGHEDISIKGKVNSAFMMKAYAFQAGVARITYSWGVDPAKCARAKARKAKEAKAKHAAKRALKHKMKEGAHKHALKVLKGGKGCKGAHAWVKTSRAHHAKAKSNFHNLKKALGKCHVRKGMAHKLVKLAEHDERKFKNMKKRHAKKAGAPAVYQHCNFGGYKKVLHHSTIWVKKMGIKNDDLSSIKVPAGKCVTLYQHAHYRGKSWKICGARAVKCFVHHKMLGSTTWNDQVSSIRVSNKVASSTRRRRFWRL